MGRGFARRSHRHSSGASGAARLVTHGFVLTVVFLVAACTITGSVKDEQADANVCQDVNALALSLSRVSQLDPAQTPAQDIRRSVAPMRGELQALSNAVRGVGRSQREHLQPSLDSLDSAVASLETQEPISQALSHVGTELDSAAEAFQSYIERAGCDQKRS